MPVPSCCLYTCRVWLQWLLGTTTRH